MIKVSISKISMNEQSCKLYVNLLIFPSEEHPDPSSSKTQPTRRHAPQMDLHAPGEKYPIINGFHGFGNA
jgi:hypothetical protein